MLDHLPVSEVESHRNLIHLQRAVALKMVDERLRELGPAKNLYEQGDIDELLEYRTRLTKDDC